MSLYFTKMHNTKYKPKKLGQLHTYGNNWTLFKGAVSLRYSISDIFSLAIKAVEMQNVVALFCI